MQCVVGRVPIFCNAIRHKWLVSPYITVFLKCCDGVETISFHVVITETIEADLFDQPARQFEQFRIDVRVAMRKIGHLAECAFIPGLVVARVKAFPVARELPALRFEQSPARLIDERIELLFIPSVVVVEDDIRDHA